MLSSAWMELAHLRQQLMDLPVSSGVLSPFSVRRGPSLERPVSAHMWLPSAASVSLFHIEVGLDQ